MPRKEIADIAAGRLSAEQLAQNFADVSPPLDRQRALIAAQRCYYCYDAPCVQACPTGIDIPGFIRRITTGNLDGAARDILGANILGGMCARVCPTEILCEGSCVRNGPDELAPVQIGALQRYATDWVFENDARLFERGADSGFSIAVVGAGPAGLACAHALARAGHRVTLFDAREKPGGLNEYGIAAYKVPGFAAREVEWLLSIGGIELRTGEALGSNLSLASLQDEFDAVFLGVGLTGVNALGLDGERLAGVRNAVDFIAELRQCKDLSRLAVGRRVVVIGGGNTAIDASVQSRKLGAEHVTLAYRRGAASDERDAGEQRVRARPRASRSSNGCSRRRIIRRRWRSQRRRIRIHATRRPGPPAGQPASALRSSGRYAPQGNRPSAGCFRIKQRCNVARNSRKAASWSTSTTQHRCPEYGLAATASARPPT